MDTIIQFIYKEFNEMKVNIPGPSGDLGGMQKMENFLLETAIIQCTLDPVKLERLIRYCNNYGPGGPNGRIRRACIPALQRQGIILKGDK